MNIRILLYSILWIIWAGSPCIAQQFTDLDLAFKSSEPMPAKLAGRLLYLPIKINGSSETYYFLVDTGAAVSVIDVELARKLHIGGLDSSNIVGVGSGSKQGSITDSVTLDLPDVTISNARLNILFNPFHAEGPDRPMGILGFDILKKSVLKMDYANRTVTIFDPTRFTDTQQIQIPMAILGQPRIEITLVRDGIPFTTPTIVDTGAVSGVTLTPDFMSQNSTFKIDNPHSVRFLGIGGFDDEQVGTVPELHLGDQVLNNQPVELMSSGGLGAYGLLGTSVIGQYDVTFDSPDNLLLLRPNGKTISQIFPNQSAAPPISATANTSTSSEPQQPQTAQGTGFDVKLVNGSFVVISVTQPHARMHVGDLITQIDNTPTTGMDVADFQKLLQKPIRRITLSREGFEMQMRMTVAVPVPVSEDASNPAP